ICIPGFGMLLYPAWEVPLAYLFVAIFVALFFRDKLWTSLRPFRASRAIPIILAVVTAAALGAAFLVACKPALRLMAGTVFPGRRISRGGDYSLASVFKGMYNSVTSYSSVPGEANRSEYASFYHLYPAVILALCLSRRLARGIGAVGWATVCFLGLAVLYQFAGFWTWIAKYSLWGLTTSYRVDIAIGVASIIFCLIALDYSSKRFAEQRHGWEGTVAVAGALALGILVVAGGLQGAYLHGGFPPIGSITMAAALAGVTSYCLLRGKTAMFVYLMGTAVIASSAFFNPLSTNLNFLYRSDIAAKIQDLDKQSDQTPLWVCYGPDYPGILVSLLGGRSISGIEWPPQTPLWKKFDPSGEYEPLYNRFAHVHLTYEENPAEVHFEVPKVDTLVVGIAPDNRILKSQGARYILAAYWAQQQIDASKFPLIYRSQDGNFSIFAIP
ncbi:MAG TPA: hypothetical protein VI756_27160, partial [Blastocatellia bacterium]